MSPIKILFVEANPIDTNALRTTQELRDLQKALKDARFGAGFEVIPMLAARRRSAQRVRREPAPRRAVSRTAARRV